MEDRPPPQKTTAHQERPRMVVEAPPIDMEHLTRQTLGDDSIAREVLGLFLIEMGAAREAIGAEEEAERREVAHRLKGAARAIGAFSLAESAAHIEATPGDGGHVSQFLERIAEIEAFIASYDR
ncbi:MAG: Hpt domain-containing protein [Rhizobiaceae bacterium]|nr:Hpt domain-containing protein [Rhizobiaceae bacterium]